MGSILAAALWVPGHAVSVQHRRRSDGAMASAACLLGYLHGYSSCSQDLLKQGVEAFEAEVESVKKIYQDAYKTMSDDSLNALKGMYILLPLPSHTPTEVRPYEPSTQHPQD